MNKNVKIRQEGGWEFQILTKTLDAKGDFKSLNGRIEQDKSKVFFPVQWDEAGRCIYVRNSELSKELKNFDLIEVCPYDNGLSKDLKTRREGIEFEIKHTVFDLQGQIECYLGRFLFNGVWRDCLWTPTGEALVYDGAGGKYFTPYDISLIEEVEYKE